MMLSAHQRKDYPALWEVREAKRKEGEEEEEEEEEAP
jgi:hypothetical protein